MERRQYCPAKGDRSPFHAEPSASDWSTPELNWLHVDFSDDHEVFGDSASFGFFHKSCHITDETVLGSLIVQGLGMSWDEIMTTNTLPSQYEFLRKLGRPKRFAEDEAEEIIAASSAIGPRPSVKHPSSSPSSSEEGSKRGTAGKSESISLEPPSTPTPQFTPHVIQHSPLGIVPPRDRALRYSDEESLMRYPHLHDQDSPSPAPTRYVKSPPTLQTRKQVPRQSRQAPAIVSEDYDRSSSDSTYKDPEHSNSSDDLILLTEDIIEDYVADAVKQCLDTISYAFARIAPIYDLPFVHDKPPHPYEIRPERCSCKCTPDRCIRLGRTGGILKSALLFGEVLQKTSATGITPS